MDRSRIQELPAEESGSEVDVDRECGHLSVGQGELHPAVVQDLPIVILDVLKTLHCQRVNLFLKEIKVAEQSKIEFD